MKQLRIILSVLLLLFTTKAYAEEGTAAEYRVKAVVLFNFAKYVQWPAKTFSTPDQAIKVCIIGKSPFGDVFSSSDAPKEAQSRPLKVTELPATASQEDISSCQIAFWTEENNKNVGTLMTTLKEHSVLTVADSESEDALVSFLLEDGKVRFKMKHKSAKALGIEISSQLLKLAVLDE